MLRGREMSWMRIERYWEGGTDGEPIEARFVPMMCQHCDNAPVRAGLSGLRGLPHARRPQRPGVQPLRRHALLRQQLPVQGALLQLARATTGRRSPSRSTCSSTRTSRCARAASWRSARSACSGSAARSTWRGSRTARCKDGDVVTACQQACPSRAITFGDMNDPESAVLQDQAGPARLPRARRDQRPARGDVPGQGAAQRARRTRRRRRRGAH